MNENRWIIITGTRDAGDWNVEHHLAVTAIANGGHSNLNVVRLADKNSDEWRNIKEWRLLVLNRDKLVALDSNLPIAWPTLSSKVWIHFGGGELADLNAMTIRSKWTALVPRLHLGSDFAAIGCWPVMPFSRGGGGGCPWNETITGFRRTFAATKNTISASTLDHLFKAWEEAARRYFKEKPLGKLLEVLFPLYVDVSNHFTDALDDKDWEVARQLAERALKANENEIGQAIDTISEASALSGCFSALPKHTLAKDTTDASLHDFSEAFKRASQLLTSLMLLQQWELKIDDARRETTASP